MPPTDLTFGEVRVVAAAVDADRLLGEVEFDDGGHAAGQELPVVGDDDHADPLTR